MANVFATVAADWAAARAGDDAIDPAVAAGCVAISVVFAMDGSTAVAALAVGVALGRLLAISGVLAAYRLMGAAALGTGVVVAPGIAYRSTAAGAAAIGVDVIGIE